MTYATSSHSPRSHPPPPDAKPVTGHNPRDADYSGSRLLQVRDWIRRCSNLTLGLAFPPCCANCDAPLDVEDIRPQLCDDCVATIFHSGEESCQRCGAYGVHRPGDEAGCIECRERRPVFDRVVSLGRYEGSLQAAIVEMKYSGGEHLAAAVGRLLANSIDFDEPVGQPDLISCIPRYWLKRLVTGANSAEAIMSGLGKQASLPTLEDLLVCQRRIRKQSLLSPEQRRRNVRRAWSVNRQYDIRGTHVLLVDDLMTTGATANQAASVLKGAGAKNVSVAVVGRAVRIY